MTEGTTADNLGPGKPVYEKVRSADNSESLLSQAQVDDMAFRSLLLVCFIITATFCFDYSMNDGEYAHALAYYNREISSQFSQLSSMLDEQGEAALREDQQEWQRQTNRHGFGHGRASVIETLKQRAEYLEARLALIKEQKAVAARNWQAEIPAPASTPPETQARPSGESL